jgi:hypothetical protein
MRPVEAATDLVGKHRLGGPRWPDDQHMVPGQQRGQRTVDDLATFQKVLGELIASSPQSLAGGHRLDAKGEAMPMQAKQAPSARRRRWLWSRPVDDLAWPHQPESLARAPFQIEVVVRQLPDVLSYVLVLLLERECRLFEDTLLAVQPH